MALKVPTFEIPNQLMDSTPSNMPENVRYLLSILPTVMAVDNSLFLTDMNAWFEQLPITRKILIIVYAGVAVAFIATIADGWTKSNGDVEVFLTEYWPTLAAESVMILLGAFWIASEDDSLDFYLINVFSQQSASTSSSS